MPRGRQIYSKSSDMEKDKMCAYTQSDHALPHCKFVIIFCSEWIFINIHDQEIYNHYSDTAPSIQFHIYHINACCNNHGRILWKDKKICRMCKQEYSSDESTKYIH